MGRNNIIRCYFNYDKIKQQQICLECNKALAGDVVANMVRHLQTKHKDIFLLYHGKLEKSINVPSKKCQQLQTIKIQHSEDRIWQGCVEMVTKGGLPFSFISSNGFKTVIGPVINQIICNGSFNEINLKNQINTYAIKIKNSIKETVKGKMLSLMIDSATRLDRSILGINIQYLFENKLVIKTLAMRVLTKRHTSVYLKHVILEVLSDFNIEIKQVYCITSDNGRNMIRVSQFINEKYEEESENDFQDSSNINNEELVDALISTEKNTNCIINCIRCAAHTLQLVVTDVTKCLDLNEKLNDIRKVAIELRRPTNLEVLKSKNLKLPILNVPTRWNSSFNMAKRIQELKDFIEDGDNKIMNKPDFQFINEFLESFKYIEIATSKLQSSCITIQDFFKVWLELKANLQDKTDNYSKCILKYIGERENLLLNNPVMIAGIYLDPRFRFLLNQEQLSTAKQHLKSLYYHISHLKDDTNNKSVLNDTLTISNRSSITDNLDRPESIQMSANTPTTSKLANYLSTLENIQLQDVEESHINIAYSAIDNYSPTRISPEIDLVNYWELNKGNNCILYQLSTVIFSAPATQVSVERTFSALKFILTENRNRLSNNNLNSLLIVRLNYDYDIN